MSLRRFLDKEAGVIARRLNRRRKLLGPGQKFKVSIFIEQGLVTTFESFYFANVGPSDVLRILSSWPWREKYRLVFEELRVLNRLDYRKYNEKVGDSSADIRVGEGDFRRANLRLTALRLPYRLRSRNGNVWLERV